MVWLTDDEFAAVETFAGMKRPAGPVTPTRAISEPHPGFASPGNFTGFAGVNDFWDDPLPSYMPGPGQNDIGIAPRPFEPQASPWSATDIFLGGPAPTPGFEAPGGWGDVTPWQPGNPWAGTAPDQQYSLSLDSLDWLPDAPMQAAPRRYEDILADEYNVNPNTGGGWGDTWADIDQFAMKPLDFANELGRDATPILLDSVAPLVRPLYNIGAQAADQLLPDWAPRAEPIPSMYDSGRMLREDIMDPAGAVEDFRSQPFTQQLAAGMVYDPTNWIGLGAADTAVDLAGPAVRRFGDDVAGAVGRYGDDLAQSPSMLGRAPRPTERLMAGAIDPATGRPFEYADMFGGAPDPTGPGLAPYGAKPKVPRATDLSLPKGEEVVWQGKTYEVARKFTGSEQGWVALKDPATGEKTRARRMLVEEVPGVRLYHGTDADTANIIREQGFTTPHRGEGMAPGAPGFEREITFLSPHKASAKWYAEQNLRNPSPDVVEATFTGRVLEPPKARSIYDAARALGVRVTDNVFDVDDFRAKLKAAGYDAVAFRDPNAGNRRAIAVFDQSKLATVGAPAARVADAPTVNPKHLSTDGSEMADMPALPRTASGGLEPPKELPPAPSGDQSFRQAIMNHLRREWYYRISGSAKAELRAGRARQATGIVRGIDEGATGTEAIQAARAGARGKILSQTEPLNLTPAQVDQANTAIVDALKAERIRPFDVLQADDALKAMLAGDRPQPAQMRLIRKIFGDDIADLVAEQPVTQAALDRARRAQQARDAEALVRNVEKAKKAATASRLKANTDAQKAAAEAFEKFQKADDAAKARAARAAAKAREDAVLGALREDQVAIKAQDSAQARLLRDAEKDWQAKQAAWLKLQNEQDAREIRDTRRYIEAARVKAEKAAQKAAGRENRAAVEAAEKADKLHPNDEMVLKKALAKMGEEANVSSALNRESVEALRETLRGNRVILDTIGEAGEGRLRALGRDVAAAATGDVGDSYVTHLATQREILRGVLEQVGTDPGLAKKVADAMVESEIARRYRGATPERIAELLAKTRSSDYGDELGTIARGAAMVSQTSKNTMFGPLDMGLPAIQGLHAANTNSIQITAGLVNRLAALLHLPHIDTAAGSVLSKRARYSLDGVVHGVSTGATDVSHEGTILSWFGKPGKTLDIIPRKLIEANNNLQFGLLMGTLRDVTHEGNLVIAKVFGSDIADPAVRRAMAMRSNAATSGALQAVSSKRALAERATLLTPSMTRAQIQQAKQLVQGLVKPGSRAEFLSSAATIVSVGISLLIIGKVINDRFGLEDFTFDPSKPGFGRITIPVNGRGLSVDLFPQQQIVKYTSQAVRALLEAEPREALEAVGKLGIGRASPALQQPLKALDLGFDPKQERWALGDWGQTMNWEEKLLAMLPLPPVLADLIAGHKTSVETVGSFFGANANYESEYAARNRKLEADPNFGKPWEELDGTQRKAAEEAYGQALSRDDEVRARQVRTDEIQQERAEAESNAFDQLEQDGNGAGFRKALEREALTAGAKLDELYRASTYEPDNQNDIALGAYFDTFDKSRDAYGNIDEELRQKLLREVEASWTPQQRQYVEDYLGTPKDHADPRLAQFYAEHKQLEDSRFWEIKDNAWAEFAREFPQISQYGDYYQWRDAYIQWEVDQAKGRGEDPKIARQKATDAFYADEAYDIFLDYVRPIEDQWVEANPESAMWAWSYGYWKPDKAQKDFLDQWAAQR